MVLRAWVFPANVQMACLLRRSTKILILWCLPLWIDRHQSGCFSFGSKHHTMPAGWIYSKCLSRNLFPHCTVCEKMGGSLGVSHTHSGQFWEEVWQGSDMHSRCFPNMPQGASSFDDDVLNHKNYYWLFSSPKICFFRIRSVFDQADRNWKSALFTLLIKVESNFEYLLYLKINFLRKQISRFSAMSQAWWRISPCIFGTCLFISQYLCIVTWDEWQCSRNQRHVCKNDFVLSFPKSLEQNSPARIASNY